MKEKMKLWWRWIGTDGLLHIETSLIIYLFVAMPIYLLYGIIFSIPVGFVVAFIVGCVKELNDIYVQNDNTKIESNHDVVCNFIGICVGILFNLFLLIF